MAASQDDDFERWLDSLGDDETEAVEKLWEQYFEKLSRFARQKLGTSPRRSYDEEDVALSALDTFIRGVKNGRFESLGGEHELWKLLLTIVSRKARARRRKEMALKRGGGQVRGESVFGNGDDSESAGLSHLSVDELTPDMLRELDESTEQLLAKLPDDSYRLVATRRLEGYSCAEIAETLGVSKRTVERKVEAIRQIWGEAEPASA